MQTERENLEAGIAAMEAQRSTLGDAIVDAMLAPARARMATLGHAVEAGGSQQQLKQVAILFLDVVGSTPLAQHLDPEEISAVLDGALRRGAAIVAEHGGKTLQFAGDNLLAAFGVDESREDDSARAVRCGLALLELGRTLGAEVSRRHGREGFGVRVGIHTGEVLLGGGVDADGTIRGIAVHIAARMEQTAPAGALRISHDTYATVHGLFEVQVQEPLAIKGVDEPVQSYLVVKARQSRFRSGTRGIEGVATAMIGRADESVALQDAFSKVVSTRRLVAVTVTADAGVGKSRLLHEFETWLQNNAGPFHAFRGSANPQTRSQPYDLLRDVVAGRFEIGSDDTLALARRKMQDGIIPLFAADDGAELAEGHAHLLGHLIGIDWHDSRHIKGIADDPQQIRSRAFHAAAQLFRRVAASDGKTIVLVLEDLHWSDNESLDFFAYLTEIGHDAPILIVASTRPTLFERRANWWAGDFHDRIALVPLDATGTRQLVDELLRKLPELRTDLRETIARVSGGNPFYLEELVKMLIDRRAIETGDVWRVDAARLLATKIPVTLTGVLQARLDSIDASERVTLQTASVIGQVFWDQALFVLDPLAARTLPQITTRGLTLDRGDPIDNDLREYAFQHAILHQVTYGTVLKKVRRDLHGKLGRWFAAQTGLRANDFLAVAAWHYEEAGDPANAAEFYARAAEQAGQRMAHDAVHATVERGLAQLDALPGDRQGPLRWRLLMAQEAALNMQGERTAQREVLLALQQLAEERDEWSRAYAALRRSYFAMRTGDSAAMLDFGQRAASSAARAGDVVLRLKSSRQVAFGMADQGDLEGAHRLASQVLAEAVSLGFGEIAASCHNALAVIADMQGDPVAALASAESALAADQASLNRQNEAIDRANVGAGWLLLGDVDRVRFESEEGLRLLRANGDRAMECVPLCNLSKVEFWQGNATVAADLARAARTTASSVRATQLEVIASLRLGDAELALGHREAAVEAFRWAASQALALNSPLRHDANAALARVALSSGDVSGALEALEALLASAPHDAGKPDLNGADDPRWIEITCFWTLDGAGDSRAGDWLRRAHEALVTQALRIGDERVRAGFLSNIPHHREIVATWQARAR